MSAGSMTTNGWPEQSEPYKRAMGEPLDWDAVLTGAVSEQDEGRDHLAAEPLRQCRVCGCTDDDCTECLAKTGQACWWVASDLCSACQLAAV